MTNFSANILICMIFFLLSILSYKQRNTGREFHAFYVLVALLDVAAIAMMIAMPIDQGLIRANVVIGFCVNLIYRLSLVFAGFYWMLYAESVENKQMPHSRRLKLIALVPALAFSALYISAIWNHLVFSVNADGQFIRGPWYILQYAICYLYVLHIFGRGLVMLMAEKLQEDYKRELQIIVFYAFITMVFGYIQYLYGGGYVVMGMCFGTLCMYANLTTFRAEQIRQAQTVREVNRQLAAKVEEQTKKIQESNEIIIETLGSIVEDRNMESGTHIKRVKQYTEILARQMSELYPKYGLDEHKVRVIAFASALHDIGKIAISDAVLLKPGKLTTEEFSEMQNHTIIGYEMLGKIKGAWEQEYGETSELIAKYHHERYDGKGYPEHLKGDAIPISAQIVSVADVFDALVTERVYKPAYTPEKAYEMIMDGECGQFSPEILKCLQDTFPQFQKIAEGTDEGQAQVSPKTDRIA